MRYFEVFARDGGGMMDYKELFAKNTKNFTETTPKGNKIEGKILLNHGFYHGSLLIESVNGKETNQFVRGFPKIHYYNDDLEEGPDDVIFGYEKLDGTCVGFYPLKDTNGLTIEIVPKSRQRAVLDEHFCEMLHYCDTRLIYKNLSLYDLNAIYFEMFGMLNEHTLPHKKTYIDLRLIGAVNSHGILVSKEYLKLLSDVFQVPLPTGVVRIIKKYKGRTHVFDSYDVSFSNNIFGTVSHNKSNIKSFQEVVDLIKFHLDYCNEIYKKEKGYLYYEGVVLQNDYNYEDFVSVQYIKIKPDSFLKTAKINIPLSVPIDEIRKEIRKIINENLSTYSQSYSEKQTIGLINEYLLEDYSEEDVYHKKTQKVLVAELHKYINSIQDKSINLIVDDLLENSDEKELSQLMRLFSKEYPMMKHRSNDVYFILSKRLKKGK